MTGLVDTFSTPRLLELIANGRLDPTPFATHRFPLGETMAAYDTFVATAETRRPTRPRWRTSCTASAGSRRTSARSPSST